VRIFPKQRREMLPDAIGSLVGTLRYELSPRFGRGSFGTVYKQPRCRSMKRFFFDLAGDIPARDFLGHECSSKKEARKHASFIAHRIGTEKPSFAKSRNCISVRDERGTAFFEVPITSTVRHA
jgi:hypothetical protein